MSISTMPSSSSPESSAFWKQCSQAASYYAVPAAAAGLAIVPVFYGFAAKSKLQLNQPLPKMTVAEALKGGVKASPIIGGTVGLQKLTQDAVEKAFRKHLDKKEDDPFSFQTMLASSAIVGGVSAVPLAIFNLQTMGLSFTQACEILKKNKLQTAKQLGAIVGRETSFLFALRISKQVSDWMKQTAGDNKAVEYASFFATGMISSGIGHPADTATTIWGKNLSVERLLDLKRGMGTKALATGGFYVFYHFWTELFESSLKK